MIALFRQLAFVLTPAERRAAVKVFMLVVALGVLETVGVASVMPFLAVAGDPTIVERVAILSWAYERLGFTDTRSFLVVLGVGSMVVLVTGSLFRIVTHYAMLRFVSMRRHSLAQRLIEVFLSRPYEFFLNKNSADISKGILSESNEVVTNLMRPLVDVLAYGVVIALIVSFLISLDPLVALAVSGTLGGAYAAVYLSIRAFTGRQGRRRVKMNRVRFALVNEAFGGIKEVKLRSLERFFLDRFEGPSLEYAKLQATNATLAHIPRFVIEGIAFGVVMALALALVASGRDMGTVLPVLGAYTLAGYRLLPALQHVYAGVVKVRFSVGALESLVEDLQEVGSDVGASPAGAELAIDVRIGSTVRLSDVSYVYPGTERAAIRGVDLTIDANTTVGFVGATGAGKTTLVDLILGLLPPTHGRVLVDGEDIRDLGVKKWQAVIGYVPQVIYLADASIGENIAFGVPAELRNRGMIEGAARAAQLHDFVAELPAGYDTRVGERGVKLSGGQRQRIGIARALYHDPQLLVLDEGTSALDSVTEAAVMDAVRGLAHRKTIILVAHRLTTVRECDRIFVFDRGSLVASGTYEDLLDTSERFRDLARADEVEPVRNASRESLPFTGTER